MLPLLQLAVTVEIKIRVPYITFQVDFTDVITPQHIIASDTHLTAQNTIDTAENTSTILEVNSAFKDVSTQERITASVPRRMERVSAYRVCNRLLL